MNQSIDEILDELEINPEKEREIFFKGIIGIASKLKDMGLALEQLVDLEREIQREME